MARSCAWPDKVRAKLDASPSASRALIVRRAIDDVAIRRAHATPEARDGRSLHGERPDTGSRANCACEVSKIEDVGLTYLVGETAVEIRRSPPIPRARDDGA